MKFIFYPCIPYERNETPEAGNHYNCPMVTSYAENIKNNVEALGEENVRFMNPFMAFTNEEILTNALVKEFTKAFQIPAAEVKMAAHAAWEELIASRKDMEKKGEETLAWMKEHGRRGIVLAGAALPCGSGDPPRHSGAHHLLRLCRSHRGLRLPLGRCGASPGGDGSVDVPLPALRAASFVKTQDNLDLIQLNSFGCGLDAVTTDQGLRYFDPLRKDLHRAQD